MSETIKERSEMDPKYMWDLSTLYKDDAAWEEDLVALDECIAQVAQYQGKLTDAPTILKCFEADTALDRKLSNLFVYANCRRGGAVTLYEDLWKVCGGNLRHGLYQPGNSRTPGGYAEGHCR